MTGKQCATCVLIGESTIRISHCDATVLVTVPMWDLSTFYALLNIQPHPKRAVGYFEKKLKVSESIGHAENVLIAKRNIALAKSNCQGATFAEFEGIVKATRELYESGIAQLGEGCKYTIRVGMSYAIELQTLNRGDESKELLTKLLATSKQVFGPDHKTTKDVEYALNNGKLLQPNFG